MDSKEGLVKALKRMLNLHDMMMTQANHRDSAWSCDCIKEMNEAPIQARDAISNVKK